MIKRWGFYCIKINSRYCFKIYKFLFLFVCGDFEVQKFIRMFFFFLIKISFYMMFIMIKNMFVLVGVYILFLLYVFVIIFFVLFKDYIEGFLKYYIEINNI